TERRRRDQPCFFFFAHAMMSSMDSAAIMHLRSSAVDSFSHLAIMPFLAASSMSALKASGMMERVWSTTSSQLASLLHAEADRRLAERAAVMRSLSMFDPSRGG